MGGRGGNKNLIDDIVKSESFEDADPLLGVAVGAVSWSLSF